MSIATLKRKTIKGGNPRLDPVSGIGAKGFSLNGGYRNIGSVGQFRMVSNVTRTPFRGTQPMGHGGFAGEYYNVPSNSGSCCTNDDAIIKHSSLNTAGMLDEKYKWTKSQYPRYWVKDDDNANRITHTQGQLTGAKTWAAGACNFEKAANDDPDNVWKCNSRCVYWISGKKKFLYYPYAKWLNTAKVQSQGTYITAGGVARNNCLPTPACIQPYPMMLNANGCNSNVVTWQQAQAVGLLPPDYLNCHLKCPEKIMPGGIFTTNAQLEEYRGVTTITGALFIGIFLSESFSFIGQPDFSVFDCLTTIGGDFVISSNLALTSISGFTSLKTVGRYFGIGYTALTSMSEFLALETVGGIFEITYNSGLTSMSGFTSLKTVGEYFNIANNSALTSMSGFTSLETVGDFFEIVSNIALTSISGFTALTASTGIGNGVTINNNNSVPNALNVCLNTYNAINSAKGVTTFTQTPPAFTTNPCP